MRIEIASLLMVFAMCGSQAGAQNANNVPQFQVDPFWPKTLPNNWILGQVSGLATDRFDRIWVVHRPASLTARERAAEQNPPEAKCCVAAPPVLVFDQSGNLIRHWGGAGQGYQWPESEHGVYIDDNDFVWLAGNGKKRTVNSLSSPWTASSCCKSASRARATTAIPPSGSARRPTWP